MGQNLGVDWAGEWYFLFRQKSADPGFYIPKKSSPRKRYRDFRCGTGLTRAVPAPKILSPKSLLHEAKTRGLWFATLSRKVHSNYLCLVLFLRNNTYVSIII